MTQPKPPDLSAFLAQIPDESRLDYLRETFGQRAQALAVHGSDPESQAWKSLYEFLVCSIEQAQLERRVGVRL
jgi:hypothetical protein